MAAASAFEAGAQPRSIGGIFSFNGIGVSYQHNAVESSFFEVSVSADFCDVLDGQSPYPGIKAGFSYNFIFWGHEFGSGYLSSLAGIGFVAGYVRQTGQGFGPMAGLTGKVGVEYAFHVPVILSLDFTPVLGMHMDGTDKDSSLRMYLDGLSRSFYPRIGIRYCF